MGVPGAKSVSSGRGFCGLLFRVKDFWGLGFRIVGVEERGGVGVWKIGALNLMVQGAFRLTAVGRWRVVEREVLASQVFELCLLKR